MRKTVSVMNCILILVSRFQKIRNHLSSIVSTNTSLIYDLAEFNVISICISWVFMRFSSSMQFGRSTTNWVHLFHSVHSSQFHSSSFYKENFRTILEVKGDVICRSGVCLSGELMFLESYGNCDVTNTITLLS